MLFAPASVCKALRSSLSLANVASFLHLSAFCAMIHCCNAHSHLAWSAGQVLADEPTQCSVPVTYVCPKSTVSLTQEQLQPFVLEALKQVAPCGRSAVELAVVLWPGKAQCHAKTLMVGLCLSSAFSVSIMLRHGFEYTAALFCFMNALTIKVRACACVLQMQHATLSWFTLVDLPACKVKLHLSSKDLLSLAHRCQAFS